MKTTKAIYFLVMFFFSFGETFSQNIGINTTGNTPNSSAGLDVDFTDKGLLIPRVALTSTTDATTISSPANSLLVYCTGSGGLSPAGYYYNSGTPASPVWTHIATGNTFLQSQGIVKLNADETTTSSTYATFSDANFKVDIPAGKTARIQAFIQWYPSAASGFFRLINSSGTLGTNVFATGCITYKDAIASTLRCFDDAAIETTGGQNNDASGKMSIVINSIWFNNTAGTISVVAQKKNSDNASTITYYSNISYLTYEIY